MMFPYWVELVYDLHPRLLWNNLLQLFLKSALLRWGSLFKQWLGNKLCLVLGKNGKHFDLLCLIYSLYQTVLKYGFLCDSASFKNKTISNCGITWYLAPSFYNTFLNCDIGPNCSFLPDITVVGDICSSWNANSIKQHFVKIFSYYFELFRFKWFNFGTKCKGIKMIGNEM